MNNSESVQILIIGLLFPGFFFLLPLLILFLFLLILVIDGLHPAFDALAFLAHVEHG